MGTNQAFGGSGAHGRPSPMAQVRIQDDDGVRAGFLARIVHGPFFHRSGMRNVLIRRHDD